MRLHIEACVGLRFLRYLGAAYMMGYITNWNNTLSLYNGHVCML